MSLPVLTKDLVAKVEDNRPTETVELPEWGHSVIMRGLSAGDQIDHAQAAGGESAGAGAFRLICLSMVDETGALVFEDIEAGTAWLRTKSGKSIVQLTTVAARLAGITGEEAEALKKRLKASPSCRLMFHLAPMLGYTVGELKRRMSSQELAEWGIYLTMDNRVRTLIAKQGMDPTLAEQMVWSPPTAEQPPVKKYAPKGKG